VLAHPAEQRLDRVPILPHSIRWRPTMNRAAPAPTRPYARRAPEPREKLDWLLPGSILSKVGASSKSGAVHSGCASANCIACPRVPRGCCIAGPSASMPSERVRSF
jgi:hypothetical protein